jgi:hypothetical protein
MIKFNYEEVIRKPSPMRNINPLARSSGKRVDLSDRVEKLSNNNSWQKTVRAHKNKGRIFNTNNIPKQVSVRLGDCIIDEDVQRALDEKHCANTIGGAKFDCNYLQPIFAAKTSKGEYISIDSQHSVSTVAALIEEGLFEDCDDWRNLEYPCIYVETDDLSFARKAFGIVNGKGKKRQSKYNELRNAVFCVRIDNNTSDEADVEAERKVQIAEKYDCYPVEINSSFTKYPGTFTHISLFNLASENALETAFNWHNTYFHMDSVHASLFPIFQDITRMFGSAKMVFTDKLAKELAGLIQGLFGDLEQFGQSAMAARTRWHNERYGYEGNWNADQYAAVLFQLYVKMGGEENVPLVLLDAYFDPKSNTGIVDFLADEILEMAV